ncbi:hypothetical protein BLOT_012121 [Blomia tropicalis]|nr:hypothetical protein BLOT_012121 [Blomia tropicalis]
MAILMEMDCIITSAINHHHRGYINGPVCALFVSLDNQKWDRLCAMTLNALKQKHSKSFSL